MFRSLYIKIAILKTPKLAGWGGWLQDHIITPATA
jgi:hypothetical protein